jgi:hypothetical protein
LPDFVLNPPITDGVILGIGSAKLQSDQQSMQFADSRARQDIAFQLSAQVQAMLTDYARTAGTATDTTALQLAENVGRQLTDNTLSGASTIKREKTKDGTWWALVSYDKAAASKLAADTTKAAIDNEAARYAEFKAMEATKLMDAQLEKAQLKPTVVSN